MSRSLSPSDVPHRDLAAQALSLPDGRVLVRHAAGVSVLGGVAIEDLERVLATVDGERTVEEICRVLEEEYDPEAVRRLLASMAGELIQIEPPARPAGPAILLLADGPVRQRLAAELEGAGFHVAGSGAALAVCALEGVSYQRLFEIQKDWIAAGVPSLFLTADPDGIRLGPVTVPGSSPCFACAQLAAFGFLRLDPAALLATVEGFRTGVLEGSAGFDRVCTALAREAREVLDPRGEPALLQRILQMTPSGEVRHLPAERVAACPVCGGTDPRDDRAERIRIETVERRPPRALPADADGLVTRVGILGGGTAGYLTALALRRRVPGLAVTLIESSDIPVVGVGEATTPLMPQFLHADLSLDIHELFREVRPTFKLGIRFLWGRPGDGDFNYPFGPVHALEPFVYEGDIRSCSLQSLLMTAGAVPVYEADGAGWINRLGTAAAYHLDNERFVAWLQRRAVAAGVERIDATVESVERSDDGAEIRALVTGDGRRLAYDLYIDASGFRSLLLEQALGSRWIGFDTSLWIDRAVVADVPHGGRFHPYTTAETMSCGWCWNIPQAEDSHRGYVFASAFQSPEEAEAEMRRSNPGMGPARLVRFRAGRHEHFWKGNVVALGNSYGFVEPLESTALHMLIREIGLLVRAFPLRRDERGLPEQLSRKVGAWWDYLRWFLSIHYRYNRRLDTPFWRACGAEVDVSQHEELLAAFRERGPLSYDPAARAAFDYPDPLWGPEGIDALLLGQHVPARLPRPALSREAWCERVRQARQVVARALPHERAVQVMAERPELLEEMAAAFRAAGPAFG